MCSAATVTISVFLKSASDGRMLSRSIWNNNTKNTKWKCGTCRQQPGLTEHCWMKWNYQVNLWNRMISFNLGPQPPRNKTRGDAWTPIVNWIEKLSRPTAMPRVLIAPVTTMMNRRSRVFCRNTNSEAHDDTWWAWWASFNSKPLRFRERQYPVLGSSNHIPHTQWCSIIASCKNSDVWHEAVWDKETAG